MTSESMIMTKEGITLASDMAITTPENKSYNCGTKIFKLTDDFPIGIMINGNVDFQNIPLETLIGEFAKTVDFKKVKSIEEIKDEFIRYLSANTPSTNINDYLSWIHSDFENELCEEIREYGFEETLRYYEEKEIHDIVKTYGNFKNEFYKIIPQNMDKKEYNLKIWKIFSYYLSFEGTGIIFAGFDKNNYYPSFFEINIHCNNYGTIVYDEIDSTVNSEKPMIKIFAINEEAYTFITGVSKDFEEYIHEYVKESNRIFIKKLKDKLINEKKYTQKQIKNIISISEILIEHSYSNMNENMNKFKYNSIDETSKSTEYLPKPIHWDLANHLIKLTALKQKFSSDYETVSSETEIAFISKPHNFEWVQKEDLTFNNK